MTPGSPASQGPTYPLRFEPIYEYRPWGGRRLAELLAEPLPAAGAIGEAWVLSDRDDHPSRVANGPLTGRSLHELLVQYPDQMMGDLAARFDRFPLLLKFLDVRTALSVQVHPTSHTPNLPHGETGKTEAWVVLQTGANGCIYAGLTPGTTKTSLQHAIAAGTVSDELASFTPHSGDAVLIPAGTVHALADLVVFEVQQNSDVTYRLYDWNNVDTVTGRPRSLQIDQALSCINFEQGSMHPTTRSSPTTETVTPELVLSSEYFRVQRLRVDSPVTVGVIGQPRALVCIEGKGHLDHRGSLHVVRAGHVWLLPAELGVAVFRPAGPSTLLEIEIPTPMTAQEPVF
jgi:mannose-6-phosphate isomerase